MEDWISMNKGVCFITDLGAESMKEVEGKPTLIGRYAVWSPTNGSGHRIVEVGSDRGQLQLKYYISDSRVYRLQTKED